MTNDITFRHLEDSSNRSRAMPGDSMLDEWYSRVRDIPIGDFNDDDLSRACRQQIHLEHVIPIAIERLHTQPLAGEIYDGELIVAMKSVPLDYWQRNQQSSECLEHIIAQVKRITEDEDLLADADEIHRRILIARSGGTIM